MTATCSPWPRQTRWRRSCTYSAARRSSWEWVLWTSIIGRNQRYPLVAGRVWRTCKGLCNNLAWKAAKCPTFETSQRNLRPRWRLNRTQRMTNRWTYRADKPRCTSRCRTTIMTTWAISSLRCTRRPRSTICPSEPPFSNNTHRLSVKRVIRVNIKL